METTVQETLRQARFSIPDYVVFCAMLMVSAGIGIYYACTGSKQNTTSEFLMGGRSMKMFPVALSILASFMSAITLLGTPAEIYTNGTQYWLLTFSFIFLLPASAYLFLPIFFKLELTSAYEYLELRFSRLTRSLASLAFSIQMILYMAVVLYAPALALSQVTGLGVWTSVIAIGVVCTFYTTVGGIHAVVLTDAFQVILMFIAMFVVVFKGAADLGGWDNIWKTNLEGGRIEFFNFDPNPTTRHTVWSLLIGGYFTWLAIYGVNQTMVQRYLTIPTLKKAQKAIWLNLPGLGILLTVTSLAGLVIYAKYHDCDPSKMNFIKTQDQLLPLFVLDILGSFPGVPGLFVSGIFSGALSTLSSGVNSLAAVTLEDLIKTYIKPDISEIWATRVTKLLALFYGALTIALVAVAQNLGSVLQAALSLFGMISGPLLGLFSLGLFFPWANAQGSVTGLLSGLTVSFWIGFGAFVYKPQYPKLPVSTAGCFSSLNFNETTTIDNFNLTLLENGMQNVTLDSENGLSNLYSLSYMWYSATGSAVVVIVGLIISFLTGLTDPETLNPDLICPVFDVLCPYLPERIRKKLRFNVGATYKPNALVDVGPVSEKKCTSLENGIENPAFTSAQEEHCTKF